jgi:hypothetical protein
MKLLAAAAQQGAVGGERPEYRFIKENWALSICMCSCVPVAKRYDRTAVAERISRAMERKGPRSVLTLVIPWLAPLIAGSFVNARLF